MEISSIIVYPHSMASRYLQVYIPSYPYFSWLHPYKYPHQIPVKSRKKTIGWWWKLYSQLSPDEITAENPLTHRRNAANLIDLLPRCQGRRHPGDAGDAQREAKPGRHGGKIGGVGDPVLICPAGKSCIIQPLEVITNHICILSIIHMCIFPTISH